MSTVNIGVLRQTRPGERRVAVVPEVVGKLKALGVRVLVGTGAGAGAHLTDSAYSEAGATVLPVEEVYRRADVLLCVTPPDDDELAALRPGQVLIGLLGARQDPVLMRRLADAGVTAVSLDLLPRTVSRAQLMDALTSQANIAGYKAALVAANAYGGYFPMMMTAAGTARPAQVLVLGAGVAGLQAIGTARRLGALVTGYDVRPEAVDEVRSLGAKFLELPGVAAASGEGGYARALTDAEQQAQQRALDERIASFDVVITTAQVPGRRPPLLVSADALAAMRPGSVVVDLAAGPLGGNVAGSEPDATVVLAGGVTVIGAGNLPATVPAAASAAYARNVTALVAQIVHDGVLAFDLADEIQAAVVVTHEGRIVNPTVADLLAGSVAVGGTA